eukprot:TRINITY_DN1804_c0_g1_i2.p1 TRINITY_DN1804_c0_g1~~TRINITY_DN1804_c0_g1_i2.p1  ORF type:complete len:354 (+),score=65.95 TRINITY_DN1804_c0_g1_i2:852-1913(+)
MRRAWLGFDGAAPQGFSLSDVRHVITIPVVDDDKRVEDLHMQKLASWWSKKTQGKRGELPDLIRATPFSSPALLSCLAKLCLTFDDVQQVFTMAAYKLCSEFGEQAAAPLDVIQSNPNIGIKISEVATTGCAQHPSKWLPPHLSRAYFEPFVRECELPDGGLGWKLVPSIYRYMLAFAIQRDGTLPWDRLRWPAVHAPSFASVLYFSSSLDKLYGQYYECSNATAVIANEKAGAGAGGPVLDMLVQYARQAEWEVWKKPLEDPLFKYLLERGLNKEVANKNSKLFKIIKSGNYSEHWLMWQFWQLLRNVWKHKAVLLLKGREDSYVDVPSLLRLLPRFLPQLVLDVDNALAAV